MLRVCLPALPLLLTCAAAWGRAGGGGGFPGDSSPSGGLGDDSDGGEFLLDFLLMLAFDYPVVGVPLLVIVVVGVLMSHNQLRRGTPWAGEGRMTRVVAGGVQAMERSRLDAALAAIKARDAAFDPQLFLDRSKAGFLKIQQAWSAQDMRPARPFISDGVMERFSIQLEMQQAQGLRNQMGAVNVLDAQIVEAESDAHFDTLHVRLTASAVDTMVRLADGQPVDGAAGAQTFVEIWSFLRRRGTQSLQRQGPIDGFCPSCGAALAISDAAQCSSCKAWINSGQYDWVLCEITQLSAWAVRGGGEAVPGFRELAQHDPSLSTPFLEDRASVAFWRWQRALAQGNAKALLPVATAEFCQTWSVAAQSALYRCRDAAVGAVEVRALQAGETMDLAHVAVRWSGRPDGANGAPQLREQVFVLGRRSGVHTDQDAGLSSCRCPNCGAPPSSRDVAACEYCATPFNDGSRNWVVTQILPFSAWQQPEPEIPQMRFARLLTGAGLGWSQNLSSNEVLAVLVSAMMADGRIDPAERKVLDQYAHNNHIDGASIDSLVEAARQGHVEIPQPQTPQEANACLNGLIEMSLADGCVDPAEVKLILVYAGRAGIDKATVTQRIKQRRLDLYRQARA